jgi:hypothetical protein
LPIVGNTDERQYNKVENFLNMEHNLDNVAAKKIHVKIMQKSDGKLCGGCGGELSKIAKSSYNLAHSLTKVTKKKKNAPIKTDAPTVSKF